MEMKGAKGMEDKYISAIEQCENIGVAFVIDCWKNHGFVMQRDISPELSRTTGERHGTRVLRKS